jgi:hypothetical protein
LSAEPLIVDNGAPGVPARPFPLQRRRASCASCGADNTPIRGFWGTPYFLVKYLGSILYEMSLLQSIQSKRLRRKVFKHLDLGAFLPLFGGENSTSAICPRPRFVFSKSHNAATGSNAGWEHNSALTQATNILAPLRLQVCDGRHNLIVTKEATVSGSGPLRDATPGVFGFSFKAKRSYTSDGDRGHPPPKLTAVRQATSQKAREVAHPR